jgi:hypothetical protein
MEKGWILLFQRFNIMYELDGTVIGIISKYSCQSYCSSVVVPMHVYLNHQDWSKINTDLSSGVINKKSEVIFMLSHANHSTQYRFCVRILFVFGTTAPAHPQWARSSSFTRFLDHTQRRTTVGRTLLD